MLTSKFNFFFVYLFFSLIFFCFIRLQTIQKKLDKSAFDKEVNNDYKNLDLTQHKLLHDGLLTFKKNPNMQLHGLLFENMIVLLQKQQVRNFVFTENFMKKIKFFKIFFCRMTDIF